MNAAAVALRTHRQVLCERLRAPMKPKGAFQRVTHGSITRTQSYLDLLQKSGHVPAHGVFSRLTINWAGAAGSRRRSCQGSKRSTASSLSPAAEDPPTTRTEPSPSKITEAALRAVNIGLAGVHTSKSGCRFPRCSGDGCRFSPREQHAAVGQLHHRRDKARA